MTTRLKKTFSAMVLVIFFSTGSIIAQPAFFRIVKESSIAKTNLKRIAIPKIYVSLQLDTNALVQFLRSLPTEKTVTNRKATPSIAVPMPDGTTAYFHIWESNVLAPELAAEFPNLKTFTGQGITDPAATIKLDWTEMGLHAQILSSITGSFYIDPYAQGALTDYISYFVNDLDRPNFNCETKPSKVSQDKAILKILSEQCVGKQLRTYRLAVACTGEYAKAATGLSTPTVTQTLSTIVTTINQVNGIYEKELAIRLTLIADESKIIFTNPATDPFFNNNNKNILIDESQHVIDSAIGSANYDMGHTFCTASGGLSYLGVCCKAENKAGTASGTPSPTGIAFVEIVAHETGHSLWATHTFNSEYYPCGGQGTKGSNVEPGSGSTIMSYAGNCAPDILQNFNDFQFHAYSFRQIIINAFAGPASTCGTFTATGNTPPVVNAGGHYIIPKSTPFVLTGTASDADGDALTYSWEEMDYGGPFGYSKNPSGNAPLFRSFLPVNTPVRYFPKLSDVIGNTTTIGEILPSYSRTVRFALTARDNQAGGAGVCFDTTSIVIDAIAAPFAITYPSAIGIEWFVNDLRVITWDPSTTAVAPINASMVKIQLSTDGGYTWPVTLLNATPNDGVEQIQVPNNTSTQARIRIVAIGNIFYNISNNNFNIKAAPAQIVYTYTGNGTWTNADNWLNKKLPPSLLPRGSEININSPADAECLLDVQQTILNGAKIKVGVNSKLKINGNLKIQLGGPLNLTTRPVYIINGTSVSTGGQISLQGQLSIMAKGVCWNTSPDPVIINNKTNEGAGADNFTSKAAGLMANTVYYLRAYIVSEGNVWYGNQVSFIPNNVPVLSTITPNAITQLTAGSGGSIINDGNAPVTMRGVCWSTKPDVTTGDNITLDGTGSGIFSSQLTGLTKSTIYYLRSYATTALGTGYGEEKRLTTLSSDSLISQDSTFIDSRDGQVYRYKTIGSQVWMTENVRYDIPGSLCYDYDANKCDSFGHLYNWNIAQTVAPPGWHLPSDAEWATLFTYLGGREIAAAAMKTTTLWAYDNRSTNSSGFTALPAGYRLWYNLKFVNLYLETGWWSSTSLGDNSSTFYSISSDWDAVETYINSKDFDLSVRCIKD